MSVLARPRRGPGRPAGGRPIIDRNELLDAAARTIRTLGPAATLDDIAATAGVAKPTIYRVLGDRAAVVLALSDHLIERAQQATRPVPNATPRLRFRSAIEGFVTVMDEERNLFLFVNASGHEASVLADLVEQSSRGLVEAFSAVARDSAAHTWAYGVIGALQVIVTMWLRDPWCGRTDLVRHVEALVWDGLERSLGTSSDSLSRMADTQPPLYP